jgi:hypothetical protein
MSHGTERNSASEFGLGPTSSVGIRLGESGSNQFTYYFLYFKLILI